MSNHAAPVTPTAAPKIADIRGPYEVRRIEDVAMRTRDGVTLIADIYQPEAADLRPTLVRRTPYGKNLNDLAADFNEAHYYASHGYLTVVQNTRGRYGSEGTWYPFVYEGKDGYDVIEWAAELSKSNGRIGTFGQSYGALSQYLAAAQRPPHLVTAIAVSAYLGSFDNYWYNQGGLELAWLLSYFMNMARDVLTSSGDTDRLAELEKMLVDPSERFSPMTDEALRHLPVSDWIERFGPGAPFLADVLDHPQDDSYWWKTDMSRQLQNIDIPVLHVGSWYDIANRDTPRYFAGVGQQAASESSRRHQALFMGPWGHLLPYNQPTSGGAGDIDFGPQATYPMLEMQRNWFDHFLRDGLTGLPQARVRIFVMGENTWRDETQWPPETAADVNYYLHSGGRAAEAIDDGALTPEPHRSDEAGSDSFTYDPADPVPTAGGRFVGGGVANQADNQHRTDVVTFTCPTPVRDRLEITGEILLTLYASTDSTDTDFTAVLSDVHPDGFVQNIAEGLCRLRFRDSLRDPQPADPGEIYQLRITMGNTSHVFKAGHRLRLHISSSDFPRFDRNLNSYAPLNRGVAYRTAHQTIFHSQAHPSALTLPVVQPQNGTPTP